MTFNYLQNVALVKKVGKDVFVVEDPFLVQDILANREDLISAADIATEAAENATQDAAEIKESLEDVQGVFDENKKLILLTDSYLLQLLNVASSASRHFTERDIKTYHQWYKDGLDLLRKVSTVSLHSSEETKTDIEHFLDWFKKEEEKETALLSSLSLTAEKTKQEINNAITHYDDDIRTRNLLIRTYVEKPYVLFIVGGQSNAAGRTMPAYESATYCGKLWDWSANVNTLVDLKDPTNMYRSGYGSAWPAFARTFFELTGRKVIILNTASGGSYVTDYGGSNTWFGEDSSLRLHTTEKYSDMLSYLSDNKIPFELGGLFWIQGEAEALKVGNGTINTDYFKECTINVFDFYKKLTDEAELPTFISQVGYQKTVYTNPTLLDGYNKIHTAQKELSTELNNTYLAFESAKYFVLSNEMYDEYHYTQYGYNKLGEAFARVSSNILFMENNYA